MVTSGALVATSEAAVPQETGKPFNTWAEYIVWYYKDMPSTAQRLLLWARNNRLDRLTKLTKEADKVRAEIVEIDKQIR